MKDRLKKKAEKRKRALIHEILDVVLDINGTGERQQEITGNLPTAFLDFSGHIGTISVRLYPEGWESDCAAEWTLPWTYTDDAAQLEQAIRALKCETPAAGTAGESR